MHALMGTSPIVDRSAIAHSQTSIRLDVLARDGNFVGLVSCRNFPLMIVGFASAPVIHLTGIWTLLAACHLLVHQLALLDLTMMILLKWRYQSVASLLPLLRRGRSASPFLIWFVMRVSSSKSRESRLRRFKPRKRQNTRKSSSRLLLR